MGKSTGIVRFLLLLGICFIVIPAQAQLDFRFQHITTSDGLPENTGEALLQDRDGYIWIGTQNGLARYDGYQFKVYKHKPDVANSISNNHIQALLQDSRGHLWINTRNGLNCLDPAMDTFWTYQPDPGQMTENNWFGYDIIEDGEGHIWTSTLNGFVRIDLESHAIAIYPIDTLRTVKQLSHVNDTLWGYADDSLFYFARGHFQPFISFDANIQDIYSNANGFTVVTQQEVWRKTNQEWRTVPALRPIAQSLLLDREEMPDGKVMWGTLQGVYITEGEQIIDHLEHDSENPFSLSHQISLNLLVDQQGNLWVGTGQGVNYYAPALSQVQRFDKYTQQPFSLPEEQVQAITFFQGDLILGTTRGILWVEDFKPFSKANCRTRWYGDGTLPDPSIQCLYVHSDSTIWAGTLKGQLLRYYAKQATWLEVPLPEEILTLRAILPGANPNQLWLGSGNGLFRYHVPTQTLEDLTADPNLQYIIQMGFVGDELWMGSSRGIVALDTQRLSSRLLIPGSEQYPNLSNGQLTDLYLTDSVAWIATFGGGVLKYDLKQQFFTSLQENDGLINNNVWCIYPDKMGRLWMSTDNGVSVYAPDQHTFFHLDQGNGLNFHDFSMVAHGQWPDGALLLGNPKGFSVIQPERYATNTYAPQVVLSDLSINYESVSLGSRIAQGQPTPTLDLYPGDKTITFQFAALNYHNPQRNRYAFMLEGYDKDWVHRPANERYASYTDLPAGQYTFRVKGTNDDGVWNEAGLALPIQVHPPFYQTMGFRLIMLMLLLMMTGGLVYAVNRRKYQRTIRQLQIQQRIQAERERISKDLHDNVGAHLTRIITDLDLLSLRLDNQSPDDNQSRIEQTRGFTQSTMQLLRDTIWAINKEQFSLHEFADKVEAFLKHYLGDDVNWSVERHLQQDGQLGPTAVLNLLRIVQEATQNMLKHAQATTYTIKLVAEKDAFQLIISDNGIGLPDEIQQADDHYGLYNMRQRAGDIGATYQLISTVGKGVTIQLQMPV